MPRIAKVRISPRKLPSQSRSLATVQVILQAAARVLARESLAGFNTNRVAEVAGISVGSLYQYFPGKEALVTALSEQHHNELIDVARWVASELEGASLEQKLSGLCRVVIEQQYSNPRLAAAIDHEERRLPLSNQLRRTKQSLIEVVMALLRSDLPNVTAREIADVYTIMKALVEEDADGRAPAPDLHSRLMRAVKGYLGVD